MKAIKNKLKNISASWYFLSIIILIYIVIFLTNYNFFSSCLNFFFNILIKIIPIFILVFILMAITNYFITPAFISKHVGKNHGIRAWIFVIITGIISTGPIYMWYPLLADLKEKGLTYGLIACFLYNRAIKIPLLPLAILYFGWKYVIVLLIVMLFISIIQGIIINKLIENKK